LGSVTKMDNTTWVGRPSHLYRFHHWSHTDTNGIRGNTPIRSGPDAAANQIRGLGTWRGVCIQTVLWKPDLAFFFDKLEFGNGQRRDFVGGLRIRGHSIHSFAGSED